MKKSIPSSRCSKCGAAGHLHGISARPARCRCGGDFLPAVSIKDFAECPQCGATGEVNNERCSQCAGVGYV